EDNEDPLINVLWDDLLALDGDNEEDEALIELIESIITGEGVSLYGDDADALMEMFSRLIENLTADEEKLSATEKLIAGDDYLSGQLKAALEEVLGLSTETEDVDLDAIIESYVNDGTTGNDALDEIISNAANEALDDAFIGAAVATKSDSLLDDITQSLNGDTTDGSASASSGSSAASGAAGPITFTVQLNYKAALLAEEQERKGLDADAIIEKLEVETE
ncbi:MAG: hypothetical protein LUC20_08225, partial [Oscillospiraceae bacterium]|nr:hypothetical protein [Oscillospiraceae bacterium]